MSVKNARAARGNAVFQAAHGPTGKHAADPEINHGESWILRPAVNFPR
jgi:hypothetical protein